MDRPFFLLALVVVYLVAAIPTGVVLTRLMGLEDVRSKGSGNIGATNVYRVAGKLPGILTLIGDILKGFLPLLAMKLWLAPTPMQLGLAGVVAIIGHCYPVYIRFRGGKGVATTIGAAAAVDPLPLLGCAVLFLIVVGLTRYVSLGSMVAVTAFPFLALVLGRGTATVVWGAAIAALIVFRHRGNIGRLLAGSERKLGEKAS